MLASRTVASEIYNFSIDTTRVQILSTELYDSYTFNVLREEPSETEVENYILTIYNDDIIKQSLVSYPIIETGIYDINSATAEIIDDPDLLVMSCPPHLAIIEYQEPVCVETNCLDPGGASHSFSEGSDCIFWGTSASATRTCTPGAWVVTGCSSTGAGDTTNGGTTGGGSPGSNTSSDPVPTEESVVTVPLADMPVELMQALGVTKMNNQPLYGWLLNNANIFEVAQAYNFMINSQNFNITDMIEEILQIIVDEPNINTFIEGLEVYYDLHPEDFMATFEYDQDNEDPEIENMTEYLDCFNDGKQASGYEFILYVDQPVRGENTVVTASPQDVGHTFFSLVKNNVDGSNVTKTLGFYPSGNDYLSDPFDLEGPGVFKDNGIEGQEHTYDVSVNFSNIQQSDFNNIISALITLENANYDLNDFNCTSVGHGLIATNLGFTLEPNISLYRWFVLTGPIAVFGISPGQYGVDLMEEDYDANVPYASQVNISNSKPRTSTSNCN